MSETRREENTTVVVTSNDAPPVDPAATAAYPSPSEGAPSASADVAAGAQAIAEGIAVGRVVGQAEATAAQAAATAQAAEAAAATAASEMDGWKRRAESAETENVRLQAQIAELTAPPEETETVEVEVVKVNKPAEPPPVKKRSAIARLMFG